LGADLRWNRCKNAGDCLDPDECHESMLATPVFRGKKRRVLPEKLSSLRRKLYQKAKQDFSL
jgi:hypothetical protein